MNQINSIDIEKDLGYLLKDSNLLDLIKKKDSMEEIMELCYTTLSQIHQSKDPSVMKQIISQYFSTKIFSQKLDAEISTISTIKISEIDRSTALSQETFKLKNGDDSFFFKTNDVSNEIKITSISDLPAEVAVSDPLIETTTSTQIHEMAILKQTSEITISKQINEIEMIANIKDSKTQSMIDHNLQQISYFKQLPRYEQKSQEWLNQRSQYLTGSTISRALGLNGPVAKKNLLIEKVSLGSISKFNGNASTQWGNKYEPVSSAIYCFRNGVTIHEFGVITNPKYPFLAVSPDGITKFRMVEFKNPSSRIIDGKIKIDYYHQMQEQMAVCEFDECDFLECSFLEVSELQFWTDFDYCDEKSNPNNEKGIIFSYLDLTQECEIKYLYSPIELMFDFDQLKLWEKQKISEFLVNKQQIYLNKFYWVLTVYNCQLVCRDPEWIVQSYPILQDFWNQVQHYRAIGLDQLLLDISQSDTKNIFSDLNNPFRKKLLQKSITKSAEKKTQKHSLIRKTVRKDNSELLTFKKKSVKNSDLCKGHCFL